MCPLALLYTGVLSRVKLQVPCVLSQSRRVHTCISPLYLDCRSRVCCPSLGEFIQTSVLLYLDDAVSLESATTSGSHGLPTFSSAQTPEPGREGSDTHIPLSIHCPLYPKLLCHCPQAAPLFKNKHDNFQNCSICIFFPRL